MSTWVEVKIPLTGKVKGSATKTIIKADPPCIYCGDSISDESNCYWSTSKSYQTRHWGVDNYEPPVWALEMMNDDTVGGRYCKDDPPLCRWKLSLPYCDKHLSLPEIPFGSIKRPQNIPSNLLILGMFIGGFIGFIAMGLLLEAGYGTLGFITFLLIMAVSSGIFYFIGYKLKTKKLLQSPELEVLEHPDVGTAHWGISIGVVENRINRGELNSKSQLAPVKYELIIYCANEEIAQKIKDIKIQYDLIGNTSYETLAQNLRSKMRAVDLTKLKSNHAAYQFNLLGKNGGSFHMIIDDCKVNIFESAYENPDVTIVMDAKDFEEMLEGVITPISIFVDKEVTLTGKKALANNLFKLIGVAVISLSEETRQYY